MNMLATSSVTCWHKACVWTYSGGGLVVKSCPTLATPWTVVHQAPLSMGFPRQECWSGLPFPSLGDLPWPRDRTWVSCIVGSFFTPWATREACIQLHSESWGSSLLPPSFSSPILQIAQLFMNFQCFYLLNVFLIFICFQHMSHSCLLHNSLSSHEQSGFHFLN